MIATTTALDSTDADGYYDLLSAIRDNYGALEGDSYLFTTSAEPKP